MQVVYAGHGLAIERNDHVTFAQPCFLSRTAGGHGNHDHTSLLRQVVETHQAPMQRRGLGLDADVAAPNSAFLQQTSSHKLGGVDSDGEAQSLRAHDGGGVHADDLAIGGHQRASGVARVERSVGLDHVVDHPSGVGTQRPSQRAHHAGRHRVLEAVGISNRNRQLSHAQLLRIAQRRGHQVGCIVIGYVHAHDRQVGGWIVADGVAGKRRPSAKET